MTNAVLRVSVLIALLVWNGADKPIRASRESARWCEEVIDLLWRNRERVIAEPERDEAKRTFEKAKAAYRAIAESVSVSGRSR